MSIHRHCATDADLLYYSLKLEIIMFKQAICSAALLSALGAAAKPVGGVAVDDLDIAFSAAFAEVGVKVP